MSETPLKGMAYCYDRAAGRQDGSRNIRGCNMIRGGQGRSARDIADDCLTYAIVGVGLIGLMLVAQWWAGI